MIKRFMIDRNVLQKKSSVSLNNFYVSEKQFARSLIFLKMNNCKKNKEYIKMKLKMIRKTHKAHAEICPSGGNPSLRKSQDIT